MMQGHGLFSLLAERLMLEAKTITITTYNVLFEVISGPLFLFWFFLHFVTSNFRVCSDDGL